MGHSCLLRQLPLLFSIELPKTPLGQPQRSPPLQPQRPVPPIHHEYAAPPRLLPQTLKCVANPPPQLPTHPY